MSAPSSQARAGHRIAMRPRRRTPSSRKRNQGCVDTARLPARGWLPAASVPPASPRASSPTMYRRTHRRPTRPPPARGRTSARHPTTSPRRVSCPRKLTKHMNPDAASTTDHQDVKAAGRPGPVADAADDEQYRVQAQPSRIPARRRAPAFSVSNAGGQASAISSVRSASGTPTLARKAATPSLPSGDARTAAMCSAVPPITSASRACRHRDRLQLIARPAWPSAVRPATR